MICSKDNTLLNEKENKIETYSLTNYSKFYKRNDPFFIYNTFSFCMYKKYIYLTTHSLLRGYDQAFTESACTG